MPAPSLQTILIVEDEPKLARLLQDCLVQAGYAVHCVAHRLEVVSWVRQHVPSLVLLDLMLPGQDGMAVCRELQAFQSTRSGRPRQGGIASTPDVCSECGPERGG